MVQTIPCSRVGYIYAVESPVSIEQLKNRQFIAESLMDDYKKHFYGVHTLMDRKSLLDTHSVAIEATKSLQKKLECNSFKWYLDEVYYDKLEPRSESRYAGLVSNNVLMMLGG